MIIDIWSWEDTCFGANFSSRRGVDGRDCFSSSVGMSLMYDSRFQWLSPIDLSSSICRVPIVDIRDSSSS